LAYPHFCKPKACLEQNPSQTRLRILSSTSPSSYEKPLLLWNHYSNKLFSLSLHCHHTWKIDWLELKALHLSSQPSNPGSHKQNSLAKQNPSILSAPMPDLPLNQQNLLQHAMTLEFNLKQPPQNIKR
jgi:hypothetical protein